MPKKPNYDFEKRRKEEERKKKKDAKREERLQRRRDGSTEDVPVSDAIEESGPGAAPAE